MKMMRTRVGAPRWTTVRCKWWPAIHGCLGLQDVVNHEGEVVVWKGEKDFIKTKGDLPLVMQAKGQQTTLHVARWLDSRTLSNIL